ncbi:type IV pilus modification PilV family protein [Dissulfurispira thermophila]|nr:prepilin-type N-terminal cleavage/methylation domain-containing protein [Dissulfurispira thermophila]
MCAFLCNKNGWRGNSGLSMIEVLIALFLTMIGVMALISMQTQGWLLSGKSDYLGRAAEILHKELETKEALIMNPCNIVTVGTFNKNIFASGSAGGAGAGDATLSIQTTITLITTNTWRLTIRVTWPGNNAGIRESLIVTRQEYFRSPAGCADNSQALNWGVL